MDDVTHWSNTISIGGGPGRTTYRNVPWTTEGYRRGVSRLLSLIRSKSSGSTLLSSIVRRVVIVPVYEHAESTDLMGLASNITNIDLLDQGPKSDNVVTLKHVGTEDATWDPATGKPRVGAESIIQFTPAFYGQGKRLAQSFEPDYRADCMLFHELVHASRNSQGVFDNRNFASTSSLSPFDTHEEYFATLLTNIYRSQQYPSAPLRASHSTQFHTLSNPQSFHQDPENQRMIELFFTQSPGLAWSFAHKIQASFNPIRDHCNATTLGKMAR